MTSTDVVNRVRRITSQRRCGHSGTLDPGATGVLLVALGQCTKLIQYLSAHTKSYTAELVLGATTSTLDDEGEVLATFDMSGVTPQQVSSAALTLVGDIMQIPPMVSAVQINGKRLHEYHAKASRLNALPARFMCPDTTSNPPQTLSCTKSPLTAPPAPTCTFLLQTSANCLAGALTCENSDAHPSARSTKPWQSRWTTIWRIGNRSMHTPCWRISRPRMRRPSLLSKLALAQSSTGPCLPMCPLTLHCGRSSLQTSSLRSTNRSAAVLLNQLSCSIVCNCRKLSRLH